MYRLCARAAQRRFLRSISSSKRNVLDELEARGLVAAVSSRQLKEHLEQPRALYLGVDPSAKSLHVGNLLALVGLLHFQLRGHAAIALIGGATGSVGDPSGRSTERKALSEDNLNENVEAITAQVTKLCNQGVPFAAARSGTSASSSNINFVNNKDWISKLSLLDFLSGPGKRARVATMLSRESVKNRLDSKYGISFTEFSYQLLQAYDFYHLHKHNNCTIQIGGSDQWGNIQSGIEMIRREGLSEQQLAEQEDEPSTSEKEPAFGVTLPLLTTSSGEKFGKSAGNAIWLDETLTSPFEFYQFFLRTSDEDVARYLRIFSFLPLDSIEATLKKHSAAPQLRIAQKQLASEVTELVHGASGLQRAQAATEISFGSARLLRMKAADIADAFRGSQLDVVTHKQLLQHSIPSLMVRHGLCTSKTQAKNYLSNGAVYLNDRRVPMHGYSLQESDLLEGRLVVLRVGKNSLKVLDTQS